MGEPGWEERVARLEGRVEDFAGRFDGLERRMDVRFEAIDDKMSKQFRWLIGGQVSVLVSVIAALAAALFGL